MLKCLLLIAALAFSSGIHAQAAQGYLDFQREQAQRDLIQAQTDALNAWTKCVNVNGPAACGPAPQAYQPPQQYQQRRQDPQFIPVQPQYDANCMSLCGNAKYEFTFCQLQCRNR